MHTLTRPTVLLVLLLLLGSCGGGSSDSDPAGHPARGISALYFDGVDDRVSIEPPAWGSTTFPTGLTIEAWILPYSLVAHPDYAAIAKVDVHTLSLDNDFGGGDQTRLIQAISTPMTDSAVSSHGTLQTGVWQHVAGTYDGTTIRVYRNGALVGDRAHPGTASTASQVLIGRWSASFHGILDEIRIWGVPRSQAEIAAAMDVALTGTEPGLLGYYRFEGTGQQVIDSSARAAHGFLGVTGADESTDPARVAE